MADETKKDFVENAQTLGKRGGRDCTIPSEDEIKSAYPDRDSIRVQAFLNMGSGTGLPPNLNRIDPHQVGSP